MLVDIIKQLNWIDIIVVFLLFRIIYIAAAKGVITELFKLMGVVFALFISLQYFTALSDAARSKAGFKNMPLQFVDFLFFLVLVPVSYLLFVIIREAFQRLVKTEIAPIFNKWTAFCLGILRGLLIASLIAFGLVISSIAYLKDSVRSSYLGRRMFYISTSTYTKIYEGVISKFSTQEKINKTISEIRNDFDS